MQQAGGSVKAGDPPARVHLLRRLQDAAMCAPQPMPLIVERPEMADVGRHQERLPLMRFFQLGFIFPAVSTQLDGQKHGVAHQSQLTSHSHVRDAFV